MQTDFHYGCVYALARSAGFSTANARTLAYACQYVDDCQLRGVSIHLQSSELYRPFPTAYEFPPPADVTIQEEKEVFLPFHLIPGGEKETFDERSLVKRNSSFSRKAVEYAFLTANLPFALHHLAIALHAHADTWAHEGFNAFTSELNHVRSSRPFVLFSDDKRPLPIGHAEVLSLPDIPWLEWEYEDHRGKIIHRDNTELFLDAARSVFEFLEKYLDKTPHFSDDKSSLQPWSSIKSEIKRLFLSGRPHQLWNKTSRLLNWQKSLSSGAFGFTDTLPPYNETEWFNSAIVFNQNEHRARPGFETSNWFYFQQAARRHQEFVLKSLDSAINES